MHNKYLLRLRLGNPGLIMEEMMGGLAGAAEEVWLQIPDYLFGFKMVVWKTKQGHFFIFQVTGVAIQEAGVMAVVAEEETAVDVELFDICTKKASL